MARDHHRLNTDIWDEASIRALPRLQQQAYVLVMSQADLSRCGVLAYRPRRWAKTSDDGTEKHLRRDYNALAKTRHVVIDDDTEELFVRTYVRHDHILAQPNVVAALVSDYQLIASDTIRTAFLTEMRRLWSLKDLPAGERGGWLLAMGHYPAPTSGDERGDWPRTMVPSALARIRKAIKNGLREQMLSAIHAQKVPPFDADSPEGLPAPFREASAKPSREPSTEPPGDTHARAGSPSPSPSPIPGQSLSPAANGEPHDDDTTDQLLDEHLTIAPPLSAGGRKQLAEHINAQLDRATPDQIRAALSLYRDRAGTGQKTLPGLLPRLVDDVLTSGTDDDPLAHPEAQAFLAAQNGARR